MEELISETEALPYGPTLTSINDSPGVEKRVSDENDFLSEDGDSSTQKYEAEKVLKTTESSQEEDIDDSDVNYTISKMKRKRDDDIPKRMGPSFDIEIEDDIPKCNPRQGNSFPVIESSDGLGYHCRNCLLSKRGKKEVLLSGSWEKALKDKKNIFACQECGTHYVKYESNGKQMFRTKYSGHLIRSMSYPKCPHCKDNALVRSLGKYIRDKNRNIDLLKYTSSESLLRALSRIKTALSESLLRALLRIKTELYDCKACKKNFIVKRKRIKKKTVKTISNSEIK
jgi:ribosomal protein L37AE/L43A